MSVVFAAVLFERIFDRVLSGALQVHVERGARRERTLGDGLGKLVGKLRHLVERVIQVVIGRALVASVDRGRWISARSEYLAFGHEARFNQVIEHDIGARARSRQIDMRRKLGRSFEQTGQHCGFGQVHVARRLAKIVLRRRVHSEGAAAHVGAVEIELEDLVFG
jgi:hypothetical protein